ncbi:MAG: hypothetical protein V9G14_03990 [Cypionkella sp.]
MLLEPTFRRVGAVAIAALMLGTAPAALMAATPADTLVIASAIDDIVSIDPAEAYEFSGLDLINNVYDGLVEINPATLAMEPGLAESWEVGCRWHELYLQDEGRADFCLGQSGDGGCGGLVACSAPSS